MRPPDWRKFVLNEDVLPELVADGSRVVLWLPDGRDPGFVYWERIGTAANSEVSVTEGISFTPATSNKARQKVRGSWLGRISSFRKGARDHTWVLPNGETAERHGERRTDLVLAWSEVQTGPLDPAQIKARWPASERVQAIGENLYVVAGVGEKAPKVGSDHPPLQGAPRERAEQLLAAARKAGDRRGEAAALADLGVMSFKEGEARHAVELLTQALAIVREGSDRARESDVLGYLGLATLAVNEPRKAWDCFQQELAIATEVSDRYAIKVALDNLGTASSSLGAPAQAIGLLEQAFSLARDLGDRHHQAKLLWNLCIQHAELGQREQAKAFGQGAIDLYREMRNPEAAWYADHLKSYLAGESTPPSAIATNIGPGGIFGGSTAAIAMSGYHAPGVGQAETTRGPGLLRMAVTASKSMAKFIASGLKTVSPETQRERLEVCARCEHHTGVRCRICGCFTYAKSQMTHENCPLGKWPVVIDTDRLA
jgi:tetratricopeptide (TPR) repeat protein